MSDRGRLLLVDDDVTFTEVMARGFSRHGFEVRACHDAGQALALCRQWQPTHMVLDLNMPGVSGLVALPQLLDAAPGVAVVVLTGYSSIASAVQATRSGALDYLCKPATVAELLRAFDRDSERAAPDVVPDPPSVERLQWEHIQRVLAENDGNISATARALGMHRRTLQRKLQKRPVRR